MPLLTLPNVLTILRIILVPVILFAISQRQFVWQITGMGLFILAAITDTFDGRIARRRQQVSQFGKFADPFADKLLTLSTFIVLALRDEFIQIRGYLLLWVAIIALREIGITLLRIWAVAQGTAVITSLWGKIKTTLQLIAILMTMLLLNLRQLSVVLPQSGFLYPGDQTLVNLTHLLFFICMLVTVISGILYLSRSRFEPRRAGQFP